MTPPRPPIPPDDAQLEAWVAEFLDADPRPKLEEFLGQRARGGPRLGAALRSALEAERLLPPGPQPPPRAIGPWRIEGELGRGGMGTVFRARHASGGEERALKVLHESLQAHPRALARFRREAQSLGQLEHPGIVRLVEVHVEGPSPYLVMERVPGTSLAALLDRARRSGALELPDGDAPAGATAEWAPARLVAQLARAVHAAHEVGVLHRDLNPRNVLLADDGRATVIDFGLVASVDAETLTGTGDLIGTPRSMAPEQARGEPCDVRSDVFGLGTILLELLTLRPPRTSTDTFALLREAAARPVARPPRSMPRPLRDIVLRATGFRPEWRQSSAVGLAEELEAFAEGRVRDVPRAPLAMRLRDRLMRRTRGQSILAGGAGLLASACLVWTAAARFRPQPVAGAAAHARSAMLVDYIDGDLQAAAARHAELARLAPSEPLLEFYAELLEGRVQEISEDPLARTLGRAERARRDGDLETANRGFDIAWKMAPGTSIVPYLAGLAELELGRGDAAVAEFQTIVLELFDSPRLHLQLGQAYALAGRTEDAVLARESARSVDEGSPEVAFELALAYLANDQLDRARDEAARAHSLDPVGIAERTRAALRGGDPSRPADFPQLVDQLFTP